MSHAHLSSTFKLNQVTHKQCERRVAVSAAFVSHFNWSLSGINSWGTLLTGFSLRGSACWLAPPALGPHAVLLLASICSVSEPGGRLKLSYTFYNLLSDSQPLWRLQLNSGPNKVECFCNDPHSVVKSSVFVISLSSYSGEFLCGVCMLSLAVRVCLAVLCYKLSSFFFKWKLKTFPECPRWNFLKIV